MANPVGAPPFKPTEEQRKMVRAMTAYGIPQLDICAVVGVSLPTLNKYFSLEIDTAQAQANAKVAERLWNTAVNGTGKEAVTACIFWLKCRARWREDGGDGIDLGKKGLAAEAAKSAGAGTDWGDDLAGPALN